MGCHARLPKAGAAIHKHWHGRDHKDSWMATSSASRIPRHDNRVAGSYPPGMSCLSAAKHPSLRHFATHDDRSEHCCS